MGAYMSGSGYRFRWDDVLTPGIKKLLIANALIFLFAQLTFYVYPGPAFATALLRWFGLIPIAVTHSLNVWQPFTYLFLHGNLIHLLLNMLNLWMFGQMLERQWGTRRFYSYYFLTGVGAGLLIVLFKTLLFAPDSADRSVVTIGASGAIYGILMAAALIFPERRVWLLLPPVEIPMKVFVFIMGAIAFFGQLQGGDNVSHLGHLSGMLVGYLYLRRGSLFYSFRNQISDWKQRRLRRKFDLYVNKRKNLPPSHPDHWVN